MNNGKNHQLKPITGVRVSTFNCEWKCNCGSILGWKGLLAIVKSQTGAHVMCRNCRQLWQVKTNGATPI